MIKHYKLPKSGTLIYQSPNCHKPFTEGLKRKLPKVLTKDWDSAACSVCLEFPHKAVLLLCSSYDKGCRPYMCATSRRLSNCLEEYEKACTKVVSDENMLVGTPNLVSGACPVNRMMEEKPELLCPLCRGQVKGYTIMEEARKYLNRKRRACMQESCSFYGSYKKLKKHVKKKHPRVQTRAVDPKLEAKWKLLEREQERNDVISTILSSIPGAHVVGDYVVEPYYDDSEDDYHSSDDDYLSSDDEINYHPGLSTSILQQMLVARNSGS